MLRWFKIFFYISGRRLHLWSDFKWKRSRNVKKYRAMVTQSCTSRPQPACLLDYAFTRFVWRTPYQNRVGRKLHLSILRPRKMPPKPLMRELLVRYYLICQKEKNLKSHFFSNGRVRKIVKYVDSLIIRSRACNGLFCWPLIKVSLKAFMWYWLFSCL